MRGQEVLFNLAGQVSHIDSMSDPVTDLEINCTSQLRLLEAVRRGNPELKVVYAGTRQVYGRPLLPAGRREAPAAAGGRQRHQQDLGRVLPPRLPPGVRDPRLVAAAHQHLRPAPADPPQPPGLHRLVRAPGRARRGDPDLRRRAAEARLQPRRRRGRRVPARRGQRRRGRPGDQPRRRAPGLARGARARCCSTSRAAGSFVLVPFPPERKRIDIGDFYADISRVRDDARLGADASACARAWRRRSPTTAATRSTTCERRPSRSSTSRRTWRALRARARRGGRARARLRLVHPGPRGRGVRARARGGARRQARGRGRQRHRRDPPRARARAASARATRWSPRSISAAFSALAILHAGARPVFVDVDPQTLNIDPAAAARARHAAHARRSCRCTSTATRRTWTRCWRSRASAAWRWSRTPARRTGPATAAGRSGRSAASRGSARSPSTRPRTWARFGDGGAILVNDAATAARLRQLRNGGQRDRYRHESDGL